MCHQEEKHKLNGQKLTAGGQMVQMLMFSVRKSSDCDRMLSQGQPHLVGFQVFFVMGYQ